MLRELCIDEVSRSVCAGSGSIFFLGDSYFFRICLKSIRGFCGAGDIVAGVTLVIDRPPKGNPDWENTHDPATSKAPYQVYNIGNNNPVPLMSFINAIEKELGKTFRFHRYGKSLWRSHRWRRRRLQDAQRLRP